MGDLHLQLSDDSVLPLVYLGRASDLQQEDRICELWLGPAGDAISHFHRPYPEIPEMPPVGFSISFTYGTRFLAKVALGLGHIFLRPAFATSGAADLLRSLIWQRSSDVRAEIPGEGSDFFYGRLLRSRSTFRL